MFGTTTRHHNHHQHHHYPNYRGPAIAPTALSPESAQAGDLFESFIAASTFKSVLYHYRLICDVLRLRPTNFRQFYPKLKSKIRSWKAQALWSKYDKRSSHKCYNQGKAASNCKVLVIGAGPCGLRAAIEAQLLGAKVVVVEKRDRFSRNNVLHLWPFVIADLRALGAKKFYGKFCAGAIDHISIRQLQCILLKVALLLGVEVKEGVAFEEVLPPPEDQSQRTGWHARFSPAHHPVNHYEFDVLIGADGKRNTLLGFRRKEFRGKLAIAITANFINRHSEQEARVQEISGVAFIFNQKFFKELYAETGIDLENIVYYKDETHYFVMTAKKHSLIDKGVIIRDYSDTQQLLHPSNVDRDALCSYAREAADFSTNYLLPHTDFAVNHYGKPDIAMFDFTSMFAADNACRVNQKHGHKLLKLLVGDSLLEPFWPTGSGCARGFLSCFDACWAIRSWASDSMTRLEVVAERESTYRLLGQTTPENLAKDITSYTLEPSSRYPTINLKAVLPFQVRHLVASDQPEEDEEAQPLQLPRKRKRRDSIMHPDTLLAWCQKQLENHENILVEDLDVSFKSGMALCAIIHRYRPFYIELPCLDEANAADNNQLAFDIMEKEFSISPVMTGAEMAACSVPDRLTMISYLSQICDVFRGQIPQHMGKKTGESSQDLEDFPMPAEGELPRTNLVKRETSRSEGNLIMCKMLNTKENISKDDLYRSKKLRSEVGSLDKLDRDFKKPTSDPTDKFSDRVKDLQDKFKDGDGHSKKPKELVRAIGKLGKSDWNMAAIERKIKENPIPGIGNKHEKVPKWNREAYNDKQLSIERRLRENGEDEDRIAKYLDIDASLKRMERKLKEGSTLDVGLRGHNKVSNLANQLASKLVGKEESKTVISKQPKSVVMPTSSSDLCYFCSMRVYLVERMSAEGKFFHRKCFKCSYCHSLLRLGNYIYDREGRYGGHFFCIPHFGMAPKAEHKRREPLMAYNNKARWDGDDEKLNKKDALYVDSSMVDGRGTTPERVEFENSIVEQSDEDEYLSEDEWTDRNFGMSANELDDTDSECSDFGDDDDEDQLEYEMDYEMSAEKTKQLAETWKRCYSSNPDITDRMSDSNELSEERGADGDESHTATDGEYEDDAEDDGEAIKRARDIRRQELNINIHTPLIHSSDSGSDTEVATEDESEESDTHIDTDSEFAEDATIPTEVVPKLVITDLKTEHTSSESEEEVEGGKTLRGRQEDVQYVKLNEPNPRTEHLQRLLRRTESSEALSARRNLLLRKNYLLGDASNVPRRSASSTDVGDRFKNFMDKISATQTKLKPAPQPSAAMQAFLNSSKGSNLVSTPMGFQTTESNRWPRSSAPINGSKDSSHRSCNIADICKNSPLTSSTSTEETPALEEIHHKLNDNINVPQPPLNYDITSMKTEVPSTVSSHFAHYSEGELFGKEDEQDVVFADAKNVNVTNKLFILPNDSDGVEAINEEIMTSTATCSDDESECEAEEVPKVDEYCPPTGNDRREFNLAAEPSTKIVPSQFNISFVTGHQKPRLEPQFDTISKDFENVTPVTAVVGQLESIEVPDINKTELINENTLEKQLATGTTKDYSYSMRSRPSLITTIEITQDEDFLLNQGDYEAIDRINDTSLHKSPAENNEFMYISKQMPTGLEINDEKVIDSVFDRLAGEAMEDLANLDHSLMIEGLSHVNDNLEINSACDDIATLMENLDGRVTTNVDASNVCESADLEEFNDIDEETGWAEENAFDSAGEEFYVSEIPDTLLPKPTKSLVPNVSNQIDKIEAQNIEYMDISSESSSCESTEPFSYNELEDAQSPVVNKAIEESNFPIFTSLSQSSLSRNLNKPVEKSHSFDTRKIFCPVNRTAETASENSSLLDSYSSPIGQSTVRYEGYIPRFKDRVTPFRYMRDSIDVRKSATYKPLFTPSRETTTIKSDISPATTTISTIENQPSPSVSKTSKPKDGDLVRDMVMSRIGKQDRVNRRGSRGSLLLPSGSRSSLLGDILPDTSGSLGSLSSCNLSNINISIASDKSNDNLDIGKSNDNLDIEKSNDNLDIGKSNDCLDFEKSNDNLDIEKSNDNLDIEKSNDNLDIEKSNDNLDIEKSNDNLDIEKSNDNLDIEKSNYNSVEPNRNLFSDNFSKQKIFLPITPTYPENFIDDRPIAQSSVCEGNNVLLSDTFEFNTLDKDSHLINRKKSLASRLLPLDNIKARERMLEVTRPHPMECLATRHIESPVLPSATSRQLETFSPAIEPITRKLDPLESIPTVIRKRPTRVSESELESTPSDAVVDQSKAISHWNVADNTNIISDKEVRLKRLLTEHRRKEYESLKNKNVDSCVRDCLEEYRQKRLSAPCPNIIGAGPNTDKSHDDIYQRLNKRPSVLELETLQVFTAPVVKEIVPEPVAIAPKGNSQPELRKQKKSKDRERRRSLIQVVAGMFNKSDDKKKSDDKNTKEFSASVEASSSESYSSPKSPSIKGRFSKLRLSKPKEKVKNASERSNAGESAQRESNHGAHPVNSTTPSPRNLFSFLTKSTEKKVQPTAEEDDDEMLNGSRDAMDGQQTPSARRRKATLRAAKQAEHKRLRIAQEIQRQLEECEIKTRELEDKGIMVEKALRGETENVREEADLMRDWFSLVHEKNALSRWEQELTVRARELQLEDRHMRLENELRQRMACPESDKKRDDIDREGLILAEMLGLLEQKDSLVSHLEEDRKRYLEEDKDLKKVMEKKGLRMSQR